MVQKNDAPEQEKEQETRPRGVKKVVSRRVREPKSTEETKFYTAEILESHALFSLCASVWGPEKVVLRASKFGR